MKRQLSGGEFLLPHKGLMACEVQKFMLLS
jgi:hypothetical protein